MIIEKESDKSSLKPTPYPPKRFSLDYNNDIFTLYKIWKIKDYKENEKYNNIWCISFYPFFFCAKSVDRCFRSWSWSALYPYLHTIGDTRENELKHS